MLSNEIVKFAEGNTDFYVSFADFYQNKDKASQGDREALNKAFFSEIERVSGVSRETMPLKGWCNHPTVQWASFAVVDAVVNAILPQVLTPAFRLFMDFRFVGAGDVMRFKVKPKQLFTVSKGGTGERTTHRQKNYEGEIVVSPIEHIVTVYTDMYRVLAGKEDITEFIPLVVLSIEQTMYKDALGALMTGLSAIPVGSMNVTGAFDPKKLVQMCETVQVRNNGVRPIVTGSTTALMNVLPDSTQGYREYVNGDAGAVRLIKNFYTYDVLALEQASAGGDSLVLPDNKLFVISPSQDKLIKGVMSDSLTNSNNFYDNGDLTQNFTTRKAWDFVFASAASAGIYTINA